MALPERQFIRPKEAPDAFGISRATLYRWAERGQIRIYKRGGASLVSIRKITNFIIGRVGPEVRPEEAHEMEVGAAFSAGYEAGKRDALAGIEKEG